MHGELRLERVGRRYGLRGPWVLRGVDLTVAPGDLFRVDGANGTGKSTPPARAAVRGLVTGSQSGTVPLPLLPLAAATVLTAADRRGLRAHLPQVTLSSGPRVTPSRPCAGPPATRRPGRG
jgi:ABC-type branched-subunit amino acid transport system ATPase component